MTTPSGKLPPPLPPRGAAWPPPLPVGEAQSLSYFVPPLPVGWAAVGAFSVSEWHAARVILAKRDIVARIGDSVDETGHTVQLLVPAASEAYARSLLGRGIHSTAEVDKGPRGFPVVMPGEPPLARGIPFANPIPAGLSPRQIANYNIILVLLWFVLIVVLILTGLALLIPD